MMVSYWLVVVTEILTQLNDSYMIVKTGITKNHQEQWKLHVNKPSMLEVDEAIELMKLWMVYSYGPSTSYPLPAIPWAPKGPSKR